MADAYCAQCGQALHPANRFCPSCGTATTEAAVDPSPAHEAGPPIDLAGTRSGNGDPVPQQLAFARIAKVVALLSLFLPWVTVSCAGQPLASVNGLGLMTGNVTARDPGSGAMQTHTGSPELLMYLVLGAAAFALFVSFAWPRRKAATAALCACGAAAFLAFVEVFILLPEHLRHAMTQSQARPGDFGRGFDRQMEAGLSQIIRIDPAIGFWLTMAALAAAMAFNWMIRQRVLEDDPPGS